MATQLASFAFPVELLVEILAVALVMTIARNGEEAGLYKRFKAWSINRFIALNRIVALARFIVKEIAGAAGIPIGVAAVMAVPALGVPEAVILAVMALLVEALAPLLVRLRKVLLHRRTVVAAVAFGSGLRVSRPAKSKTKTYDYQTQNESRHLRLLAALRPAKMVNFIRGGAVAGQPFSRPHHLVLCKGVGVTGEIANLRI